MAKARKLKSGSWHCIVYAGKDETGKRIYRSFTVRDPSKKGKRECERLAAEWSAAHQDVPSGQMTVFEAVRKYIDIKEKVLSPSTVRGYELYLKRRIRPIQDRRIDDLTPQDVQKWINDLSTDCTPKYIKNVYGLLSAALSYYGARSYDVTFPSTAPKPLYTPCDDDIRLLLEHIQDRPQLRSCVLLAAFGSLRRGEICALQPQDMTGNRVRVCKSMIRDIDGYWHIKPMAKTDESNRTAVLPPQVAALVVLPVRLHPEQVSNRFRRAVKSCGCTRKFRFHDLRHYYVSIAHALGVPDAYIMQMGGWRTDHVMHRVYRDTLPDVMAKEQDKLTQHFTGSFCKTFCIVPQKQQKSADPHEEDQALVSPETRVNAAFFDDAKHPRTSRNRAGGGTRTHTPSRTADFESASSAIPTRRRN